MTRCCLPSGHLRAFFLTLTVHLSLSCIFSFLKAHYRNALIETLANFLNISDPIDDSFTSKDNKRQIQLYVLDWIPYLMNSEGIEEKVLNDLATCLIEKANKSAKKLEDKKMAIALLAVVKKTQVFDNEILSQEVNYFISIIKRYEELALEALRILYKNGSEEEKQKLKNAFVK